MAMPSSSYGGGTPGPSPSSAFSSLSTTVGAQQKINVVTRLAIEGKAKHSQDGASIKMYFKMAIPIDILTPGSTVTLFPEENLKVLAYDIHPLDNNSIPFNFSSEENPLLHNAARALNLPARSTKSYMSVFAASDPTTSMVRMSSMNRSSSTANGLPIQALDAKYTGQILVSGYHVSYVIPKELPPLSALDATPTTPTNGHRRVRRLSVGERQTMQFMAAIEVWVPYATRPPRAPYLISIPTPRCLSNTIRLQIFPPPHAAAASLSSLSSEEDSGSWDLTSEPHVTRSAPRGRSNTYNHFADDESSDNASTGFADGCGIQGTFPSTERIRLRWALPHKSIQGDGRGRVGVTSAKSEMTCTVLGKGPKGNGIAMHVQYKGTCQGLWFPGVATMLGMDVGLEAKGSEVSWLDSQDAKWVVSGEVGYTGFDVGGPNESTPRRSTVSNARSFSPNFDDDSIVATSSSAAARNRPDSSSLMRTPPPQNVMEYSFEGSQTSSLSATVSSLASLPPLSPGGGVGGKHSRDVSDDNYVNYEQVSTAPITVHLNMNDFIPPAKNSLTFTIEGKILLTPRPRRNTGDRDHSAETILLPHFSLLAADVESTTIVLRNNAAESALVDVFRPTGDLAHPDTHKLVLQRDGVTRCGSEGLRISLRSMRLNYFGSPNAGGGGGDDNTPPVSRPRTPSEPANRSLSRAASMTSLHRAPSASIFSLRPARDGPLMIPWVDATVSVQSYDDFVRAGSYAVRLSLPAPANVDSEWFEFGIVFRSNGPLSSSSEGDRTGNGNGEEKQDRDQQQTPLPPRPEAVCASVDGVPVHFEIEAPRRVAESIPAAATKSPEDDEIVNEWISWARVHTAEFSGATVVIDYLVTGSVVPRKRSAISWKQQEQHRVDVFVPAFTYQIGRLQVALDTSSDVDVLSLHTHLNSHEMPLNGQQKTFLFFQIGELFYPRLTLQVAHSKHSATRSNQKSSFVGSATRTVASALPTVLSLFLLLSLLNLGGELMLLKRSVEELHRAPPPAPVTLTETLTLTVTQTNTVHAPSATTGWWVDQTPSSSSSSSSPVIPSPPVETPKSPPPPSPTPTIVQPSMPSSSPPTPSQEPTLLPPPQSLMTRQFFPLLIWLEELQDALKFTVPPALQDVSEVLRTGWGVVWKICKRIYHYPLDPP